MLNHYIFFLRDGQVGYLKTKAINDNDEVNETDELNYLGLNEKKKRIEEHWCKNVKAGNWNLLWYKKSMKSQCAFCAD